MALARIQVDAVIRGAAAPSVGIFARAGGGANRVVVLAAGPAATGIQPEDRLPRAHANRVEEALQAELSQPRQGLRRPDDAAAHECGDHGLTPPHRWPGIPRAGTRGG